jgi:hypothetical protein
MSWDVDIIWLESPVGNFLYMASTSIPKIPVIWSTNDGSGLKIVLGFFFLSSLSSSLFPPLLPYFPPFFTFSFVFVLKESYSITQVDFLGDPPVSTFQVLG